MKRLLPVVFFSVLFSIAILLYCYIAINAQTFDFSRAYQDYLYNYNLYRASYQNYISASNEYLTYKTLTSEARALETTREMLKNRAEALRTYLTALRMKLGETTGITNYQQNLAYLGLDVKINWLLTHKDLLSSPGSIADLLKLSSNLEQKYPNIELLSYQTLGIILSGKENSLREKVSVQTEKTAEKLAQMKKEGEETEKLERWLLEAKKKIIYSEEKQQEAAGILKTIRPEEKEKKREFNKAQLTLEEANQYLKEAVSFLSEIIHEMKYE